VRRDEREEWSGDGLFSAVAACSAHRALALLVLSSLFLSLFRRRIYADLVHTTTGAVRLSHRGICCE
jgi:hypothetical protein